MLRTVASAAILFTAVSFAAPPGNISPPVGREPLHVPTSNTRGQVVQTSNSSFPIDPAQVSSYPRPYYVDPGSRDEKSWISYWETNRDAILRQLPRRQAAAAPVADPTLPALREKAITSLLKATHAERPALRADAALALGQMRAADAFKPLLALAQKDPDPYVRGISYLSIGLLNTPDAEKALTTAKPQTEFERLAILNGLGMLDHLAEPTFTLLRNLANTDPDPEIARNAMWVLRIQHRTTDRDTVVALLVPESPHTLVSEALLTLGAISDPRDVDLLSNIASDGRSSTTNDRVVTNAGGAVIPQNRPYGNPANPQGYPVPSAVTNSPTLRAPSPIGARTPGLRVSAAIALAYPDSPRPLAAASVQSRNGLVQNFATYLDQAGPSYGGASIIAFARASADRDILIVRDILDMGTDPTITLVNPRSPLRGYAALGLGLYIARGGTAKIETHPVGSFTTTYDQTLPDYIDLNDTLYQRFVNQRESSELRAACALALGLSGNPANAQRLLQGAAKINRGDDLLLGYTCLALGLLHDPTLLNAATPLVSAGINKLDVQTASTRGFPSSSLSRLTPSLFDPPALPQTGPATFSILGRRAALLGISLLDDPAHTTPILLGAWPHDAATWQDAARALGWSHAYTAADPLIQLVDLDKQAAPEAAASLGWLFDPDHPSHLARMVIGNNYHQPQSDWIDLPTGSTNLIRNFPRLADLYLYSSSIGGHPIPVLRPATPPATP
ncbi:MAG TPA: HEAT repeat domain-containing protein [Tepidisphaeraceae bacterium]|jgi:hypothetical protein|nr:HEAT repeat domain-containing protein [Tepidisphaeraceae bacterium]